MYAEVHQELQTALAVAHKSRYRLYEYELRLALGEIKMGDASVPCAANGGVIGPEIVPKSKYLRPTVPIAWKALSLLSVQTLGFRMVARCSPSWPPLTYNEAN